MKVWEAFLWIGGGFALLVGLCFLSAGAPHIKWISALVPGSADRPSAEVSLAIITGAALAIERGMEVLWTLVDYTGGASWPFAVNSEINERIRKLGTLGPLKAAADKLPDGDAIKKTINDAIDSLPKVEELAHFSNNQKLDKLADTASQKLNAILTAHPNLKDTLGKDVDLASSLVDTSKDFLATFKENPGRRVISIYLGAIVGIVVVTVAGVDIFSATETGDKFNSGDFGVPITGIIMGLGANPTHEIIAALKKYKQSKNEPASA